MKKLLVLSAVLFLLAGCASNSHYSFVSDGDTVIFTGPNKVSYTKNDLYKTMKVTDSSAIVSDIMDRIALKSTDIDMAAIEAEADEVIETYKQMGYESYIISSYGSLDAYRDSYISTLLFNELAKIYAESNYETSKETDKPVKMQMASFNTIEEAEKCIEDANNGSTFDMAAANNNSTTTPSSAVYSDSDTSLVYEVKEYLNSTDTTGISTIITHGNTTTDENGNTVDANTYYVLNIESRNADEFKDEYLELLASQTDAEVVREYFLSTHDIQFYDQDLYEVMSETYEALK